jgi:hypothetical protein
MYRKVTIITLICFAVALSALWSTAFAQEKKYAEIVGDYEFDYEGQIMVISFWEEDGVLWAAPEGETPEALDAVEGKPLNFEVTVGGGQFYGLVFKKDESGKVETCVMTTQGLEIEGVKLEK